MAEFKKFFKDILLGLIPLLVVFSPVFLFNTMVDPYGVFFDMNKFSKMEANARYQKMKHLLNHKNEFNSLLMGSSRVNFIEPELVPDGNYYNLYYPSGAPRDHVEDLQLLLNNGLEIKNLVIGIDYLSLITVPVISPNDLLRMKYPVTVWNKLSFFYKYLFFLPNWRTIEQSTDKGISIRAKNLIKGTKDTTYFDSVIDHNPVSHVKSGVFKIPNTHFSNEQDINSALSEIEKIIQIAKKHQIHLTFFSNPTHYTTYLNMNLDQYFLALRGLSKITSFYDFSGLNSVALDNIYYHETSHYRRKAGRLIIDRIFERPNQELPDDFGYFTTADNIDNQIERHQTWLNDFFYCTDPDLNYTPPAHLPEFTENSVKQVVSVDKINGINVKELKQPVLLSIPWVKISGRLRNSNTTGKAIRLFIKSGDRLFEADLHHCKSHSSATNTTEMSDNQCWNVMIPTKLLNPGIQDLYIGILNAAHREFNNLETGLSINVVDQKNIQNADRLKQLSGKASFRIERINGMGADKFIFLNNGSHINLLGTAFDSINNAPSGGIIANLNGKRYLSQCIMERPDVVSYNNNPAMRSSGWTITIPANELKFETYKLSFSILNQNRDGLYPVSDTVIIYNNIIGDSSCLEGLSESSKQTKSYIDQVNGKANQTPDQPIRIKSNTITMSGWAVDEPAATRASKVYAEIDGKLYEAAYNIERKDVADFFKNTAYRYSGWKVILPSEQFGRGDHELQLIIVSADQKSYYKGGQKIRFITTN